MTIAVGTVGKDFVVLAADRQFTWAGYSKFSRQKFAIHRTSSIELIFMFSGEIGMGEEIQQKIFREVDSLPSQDQNLDVIREKTDSILSEMGRMHRTFEGGLQFLLAIVDLGTVHLLSFDGHSIREIKSGVEILGCGSNTSLIQFLRDKLYDPATSREQGIALTAYLVKKATQYVDACGEPIDLFVSGEDWLSTSAEILSQEDVASAIQKIETQEEFLSTLLIQTPFSSPTEP